VPVFFWGGGEDEAATLGYATRALSSEAWIREAISDVSRSLEARGSRLILRRRQAVPGKTDAESRGASVVDALLSVLEELGVPPARASVYAGIRFEPAARAVQDAWVRQFREMGAHVRCINASLLYDPERVAASVVSGGRFAHWGTLMDYIKKSRGALGPVPRPAAAPGPGSLRPPGRWPASIPPAKLVLLSQKTARDARRRQAEVLRMWTVSEAEALRLLAEFVSGTRGGLPRYESDRNRADLEGAVSRLSPYLRHGQISPRQVVWAVEDSSLPRAQTKTFGRRFFWRDLAYFQLHCFPSMPRAPIRAHYAGRAWDEKPDQVRAWREGRTGFPCVDAGMRELLASGYMRQNVRMLCARFLVETLGVDWREGLAHFHACLVDADLAINSMMWQNGAMCGVDPWTFATSPSSGKSRDPTGAYVRRWCPELRRLPTKHLFAPWKAPAQVLQRAGVAIGAVRPRTQGLGNEDLESDGRDSAAVYPRRIVTDLTTPARRFRERILEVRRLCLERNDARGYDVIVLPSGERTRVFTPPFLRLSAAGKVLAPQGGSRRRNRRKGKARGPQRRSAPLRSADASEAAETRSKSKEHRKAGGRAKRKRRESGSTVAEKA
jgi:deoxyribodipyrimidine photolyase